MLHPTPPGRPARPDAVARAAGASYSPHVTTMSKPPITSGEDVRAHREARAARARRQRMLARRRRAVALGAVLLVVATAATAFALTRRPTPVAVSPAEAGVRMVSRIRTATATPDTAIASFAALAKELAKPKAPPAPEPLTPPPGVKTIVVDKSDQLVTLYAADGSPVDRFPCASGKLYPRVGTYKVFSRKPASMSTYDNSRFYHFVIFTKSDKETNIGFHSIPIDTKGVEIGGLGKPVSHGCVRLAHEKAEFVYDWAPNGTKVVVRN